MLVFFNNPKGELYVAPYGTIAIKKTINKFSQLANAKHVAETEKSWLYALPARFKAVVMLLLISLFTLKAIEHFFEKEIFHTAPFKVAAGLMLLLIFPYLWQWQRLRPLNPDVAGTEFAINLAWTKRWFAAGAFLPIIFGSAAIWNMTINNSDFPFSLVAIFLSIMAFFLYVRSYRKCMALV